MGNKGGGGASKQQKQLLDLQLAEQRRASSEAQRLEADNKRKAEARQRQALGRFSLIGSGSELGVTSSLG